MVPRSSVEMDSTSVAMGCSHTWGVGVEADQAWPALLPALNLGVQGASADLVVRHVPWVIETYKPRRIFCLWPDWSRFEYTRDGEFHQSLATDMNRIDFLPQHDEEWCLNNFRKNTKCMRSICEQNEVELIDMTLYDLIDYIDHADRWPISCLGHHYAPRWHVWVADIFAWAANNNLRFGLRDG